MANIDDGLNKTQVFALINETQSAQNLMRDAVTAIEDLRQPIVDADRVFTLASIGVEKTLKLILGSAHLAQERQWPSKRQMMAWGHDINKLNGLAMVMIRENQHLGAAQGYVQELVAQIEANQTLRLLFETLTRYGKSGRFHYLDVLGNGESGQFEPPEAYWTELENHVITTTPELASMRSITDPDEFTRSLEKLSRVISRTLEEWWFVIHRLGVQGCFGARGKDVGWELWPAGRESLRL